jgi:hypothetical protein
MMCLKCKKKPALEKSNYCDEHQPSSGKTFAIKVPAKNIDIDGSKSKSVKKNKKK